LIQRRPRRGEESSDFGGKLHVEVRRGRGAEFFSSSTFLSPILPLLSSSFSSSSSSFS